MIKHQCKLQDVPLIHVPSWILAGLDSLGTCPVTLLSHTYLADTHISSVKWDSAWLHTLHSAFLIDKDKVGLAISPMSEIVIRFR